MSNRAWMPLHIENYLADTGHLTAAEHGAYMLLIMSYWREGGLPADERLIQRMSRLSKDEWAESRDIIAALFQEGWKHKRIDEELTKADEIIEKRRSAALGRHAKSKAGAHAEQVQSKCTDTGVPPRTDNQEPNGSSTNPRGARLAPDWSLPVEWREWAVNAGLPPERCDLEASKMQNWSINAGAKGAKKDWFRAWQNWVREAVDKLPNQRGSPPAKASNTSALANAASRLVQNMRSADEIRSGSRRDGIPALVPHLPVR